MLHKRNKREGEGRERMGGDGKDHEIYVPSSTIHFGGNKRCLFGG
jgi:GTPase involved in cell partitioning and DNA repair